MRDVACAIIIQFANASFMNSGEKIASIPAASASRASCCSSANDKPEKFAATIPKRAIQTPSFAYDSGAAPYHLLEEPSALSFQLLRKSLLLLFWLTADR